MEKSSFFNSVSGDRKYSANDFSSYFSSLLTNGVLPATTNLQVISNNNMTVTIKAGKAFINGYFYNNDSDLILPIAVADGVLNRVDRIVIQFNTVARNITAKVKKGVFATTPSALPIQRDADAFELGIADITIGKGVTSISQANITDLRLDSTKCGIVNSLIQADTTAIFNQYQAWFTTKTGQYNNEMVAKETDFTTQFNSWFDGVKNTLGVDIAGSLLNQINIMKGAGTLKEKLDKADFDTFKNSNATSLAEMETELNLKASQAELTSIATQDRLLQDIKSTTQTPTYTNGNITQIVHKDSENNVIRTDMFLYTPTLITETRTIQNGSTLVFKYYFDTDGSYNRTEVI